MTKQEIKANLDGIQKTLENMNGQDVDIIFLANDCNRGVFNGSPDGIGALLIWNMAKYPVIRQTVLKAVNFYLLHNREIIKTVETDNPEHEIVDLR